MSSDTPHTRNASGSKAHNSSDSSSSIGSRSLSSAVGGNGGNGGKARKSVSSKTESRPYKVVLAVDPEACHATSLRFAISVGSFRAQVFKLLSRVDLMQAYQSGSRDMREDGDNGDNGDNGREIVEKVEGRTEGKYLQRTVLHTMPKVQKERGDKMQP